MIKSDFRDWTPDMLDDAFGTKQVFKSQTLDDWLNEEIFEIFRILQGLKYRIQKAVGMI